MLELYDAPNICDGPCPHPCRIIRDTATATGRWTATAPLVNGSDAASNESCTYDGQHPAWKASCTRNYTASIASTRTVKRDKQGRVIEITGDDSVTFTYDGAGRVKMSSGPGQRVTYSYDSRGRILSEVDKLPGSTGYSQKTTYAYNASGHLVERRHPIAWATYRYVDNRLVEQISTVQRMNGLNASGRPRTIGDVTFVYDCR